MCEPTTITPEEVIDIVCQFYELDVDRLVKRIPETGRHYRSKDYVKGRQFIAYWLRKNTPMPLVKVGNILGGMHYSTIIHSVEQVNDEMNLYSSYKKEVFELNRLIQENQCN